MTPAQFLFWRRVQARAALEVPDVSAKILKAFQVLRDGLSDSDLLDLVNNRTGFDSMVKDVLTDPVLDHAFAGVQEQIQTVTQRGVQYFLKTLPQGGMLNGAPIISFNVLNPDVLTALKTIDNRVMQTLKDDVRETVREAVAQGITAGQGPRTIARNIRDVVGLAPNQVQAIENFKQELINGDRSALVRKLRDRRFDGTLRKALGRKGSGLSSEQVEKMTAVYRKKWIAFNAQTNARTATLQAFKAGQRLSWETAIKAGTVPAERLMHQWIGVDDDRERDAHLLMNDEIQPYDQPYSNGQLIPGDTDYNCRCMDRFFIAPKPKS